MQFSKLSSIISTLLLIVCGSTNAQNGDYQDTASPFIKKEMASELYKVFKLEQMVFYHWSQVVGTQLKALHKEGKITNKQFKCIIWNSYFEIGLPVYHRFIEITPSQLIAVNVIWTVDGVGKKMKAKGVRDSDDPEVVNAIKNKKEIIEVLNYLKSAAYSELERFNFEKEKEKCANSNNKSKYEEE